MERTKQSTGPSANGANGSLLVLSALSCANADSEELHSGETVVAITLVQWRLRFRSVTALLYALVCFGLRCAVRRPQAEGGDGADCAPLDVLQRAYYGGTAAPAALIALWLAASRQRCSAAQPLAALQYSADTTPTDGKYSVPVQSECCRPPAARSTASLSGGSEHRVAHRRDAAGRHAVSE